MRELRDMWRDTRMVVFTATVRRGGEERVYAVQGTDIGDAGMRAVKAVGPDAEVISLVRFLDALV